MSPTEPNDLPVVEPSSSACRHLRTKGMYVYTDGQDDGTPAEDDHALYWCLRTMKNFGPDDDMVGSRECRDASRSCCEPI